MNTSWHSYPKVWNLGHPAVKEIFAEPVIVEEKVDGSQFSFGKFEEGPDHNPGNDQVEPSIQRLRIRSKGAEMILDAPEKMFSKAVETVRLLDAWPGLHPGWTYRAEYLAKPAHNVLAYERVPEKHLILFDVSTGQEEYLDYDAKAEEAKRLGLEVVPRLFSGYITGLDAFRPLLETASILGGQKVEGLVVKNYQRFGIDGHALMGKFVSEAFKEVHAGAWREHNPSSGDVVERLAQKYRTPARWQKALQHLREAGVLTDSPKDIGPLMKEAQRDLYAEESEAIKGALFGHAMPKIQRASTAGLAEWYKELLLKLQFEREEGSQTATAGPTPVPGTGTGETGVSS